MGVFRKQQVLKELSGAEKLLDQLFGSMQNLSGDQKLMGKSLITSYLKFHKWTPEQCRLAKSLAAVKRSKHE